MDTNELILAELRELRADYNANARATGERLASLEQLMHELAGNGQPGRIGKLETDVDGLKRWRWYILGAFGVVLTLIPVAGWLLQLLIH